MVRRVTTCALQSQPDCPRKALYLAATGPIIVSAAGPSLVVRREPRGCARFPLARIDRVICNRNAQWSGEALLLCLQQGITVTWVDGRGRAVGDATATRARQGPFAERIERYVEGPEWPQRYANWLRRRRMAILQHWAAQRVAAGNTLDRGTFEGLKRAYVYRVESAPFDGEGSGACQALVLESLEREALDKRYWGHGGGVLELCADLAALLWAEYSLACGTLPASAQTQATKLLFFERWADTGRRRLLEHLGDLQRHVATELP